VDIERTIQFILESQAKAEVRMQKTELRLDSMEKRFDKRLNGIAGILQQGMRMLVRTETRLAELPASQKELAASQKELAASQKELVASQKETDRKLKALINSLRHNGNGR